MSSDDTERLIRPGRGGHAELVMEDGRRVVLIPTSTKGPTQRREDSTTEKSGASKAAARAEDSIDIAERYVKLAGDAIELAVRAAYLFMYVRECCRLVYRRYKKERATGFVEDEEEEASQTAVPYFCSVIYPYLSRSYTIKKVTGLPGYFQLYSVEPIPTSEAILMRRREDSTTEMSEASRRVSRAEEFMSNAWRCLELGEGVVALTVRVANLFGYTCCGVYTKVHNKVTAIVFVEDYASYRIKQVAGAFDFRLYLNFGSQLVKKQDGFWYLRWPHSAKALELRFFDRCHGHRFYVPTVLTYRKVMICTSEDTFWDGEYIFQHTDIDHVSVVVRKTKKGLLRARNDKKGLLAVLYDKKGLLSVANDAVDRKTKKGLLSVLNEVQEGRETNACYLVVRPVRATVLAANAAANATYFRFDVHNIPQPLFPDEAMSSKLSFSA